MPTNVHTHYGIGMDGELLDEFLDRAIPKVREIMEFSGLKPIFYYRGMSGTSIASALALRCRQSGIPYGLLYVRKEHERSHGLAVERYYQGSLSEYIPVFVDDFIAEGETLRECTQAFLVHARQPGQRRIFGLLDRDWILYDYKNDDYDSYAYSIKIDFALLLSRKEVSHD